MFIKRFIIFGRRYVLGFTITVLPLIFTVIICAILTPSLILDESDTQVKEESPAKRISSSIRLDINNYGQQEMPYYISNFDLKNPVNDLFSKLYSYAYRPEVSIVRPNEPVVDFVFRKHNSSLRSLVSEFYFGQEWNLPPLESTLDINTYDITVYYSRLAYHSSATAVHEVSNILLALLNENQLTSKTISTINSPLPAWRQDSSYYNGGDQGFQLK